MLDTEGWRIYTLLVENPKWLEALVEALEAEKVGRVKAEGAGYDYFGWEWHQVHTSANSLNRMVTASILDIRSSTRSSTHYMIRNPEAIEQVIKGIHSELKEIETGTEIPGDLFDNIVGQDNIKGIIQYTIQAKTACHCLLKGPPASSKTLFLMELSRLPQSAYVLAPTLSSAGLAELLFAARPNFLLIDELDRLSGDNVGVLNSLMSTGRISETKFRKTRELRLQTKVFAAGIKTHLLPADLLSRFITLKFPEYNEQQFIEVSTVVLNKTEGVEEDVAQTIAKTVWNLHRKGSDVRQCVQIGRMSNGDLDKAHAILDVLIAQA